MELKLTTGWSFHKVGDEKWYPASVPGDILSDLYTNELIDDPFYASNASDLKWIENTNWEYKCTFDVAHNIFKYRQLSLKLEGLDTYAEVFLNDSLILKADNMFCQWEISCKKLLKERNNTLHIFFHPTPPAIIASSGETTEHPANAREWLRKAPYQSGSVFSPHLGNCGIWKTISLCAWDNARFANMYLYPAEVSEKEAKYIAWLDIEAEKPGRYTLSFWINDESAASPFDVNLKAGINHQKFEFSIDNPDLWWCNGMGKQPIYELRAELSRKKEPICGMTQSFGIRKIELVENDSSGQVYFKLNGKALFIKGTTLLPVDLLRARITGQRTEDLINSVTEANINLVRIPENSIYAEDSLLDACDRRGILVWQDIINPPAAKFGNYNHFEQEIRQNLVRTRNHPSLALFNLNVGSDPLTQISKKYRRRKSDLPLSEGWLPAMISRYAPHIAYYTSNGTGLNQSDWKVWNEGEPLDKYTDNKALFTGQYGMQSYPSTSTLQTFTPENELSLQSQSLAFHQKASMPWVSADGNQMIDNYIQMYYNNPPYFESYVYLSQIFQASALKEAIESHRTRRPDCMGSVFYHFNDCWPGITWSVIDYRENKKAAWYTVRKAFANVMVCARKNHDMVSVYVVNDSLAKLKGVVKLQIMNFDGKKLWTKTIPAEVEGGTSFKVWEVPAERICPQSIKTKVFLWVQFEAGPKVQASNILYFTDPLYLDLPLPDVTYDISDDGGKFVLSLLSDKFMPNLWLYTELKGATFSDNNLNLLPNHPITLTVEYPGTKAELENDLQITSLVNSY
jgi:beta-mannosidase